MQQRWKFEGFPLPPYWQHWLQNLRDSPLNPNVKIQRKAVSGEKKLILENFSVEYWGGKLYLNKQNFIWPSAKFPGPLSYVKTAVYVNNVKNSVIEKDNLIMAGSFFKLWILLLCELGREEGWQREKVSELNLRREMKGWWIKHLLSMRIHSENSPGKWM